MGWSSGGKNHRGVSAGLSLNALLIGKWSPPRVLLGSLFLLASFSLAAAPLARFLIVQAVPSKPDFLVVLSGAAVYAERIRYASLIYRKGNVERIILTDDGARKGWSRRLQTNPRNIDRGREMLIASGVQEDRIVALPGIVRSTYDEAEHVRAYLGNHRGSTLVVVTSAYHSRRALWVYRRVMKDSGVAVGIDPVPPGDTSPSPRTWWATRAGWTQVAAEYFKFLYYIVRHR